MPRHTILTILIIFAGVFRIGDAQEHDKPSPKAIETIHVESGLLFLDGESVTPPYTIQFTPNACFVNERSIDIGIADRNQGRRRRRPSRRSSQAAQPERIAKSLYAFLEKDSVVVAFQGQALSKLLPSQEVIFLKALLDDKPSDERQVQYEHVCPGEIDLEDWRRIPSLNTPNAAERTAWTRRIETLNEIANRNERQLAAVRWLDRFTYPLTISGMCLGTVTLGVLLRWSGKGFSDQVDSVRACQLTILLMVMISIGDLVWTILAARTGSFVETNPIAKLFLHSTTGLVLFKGVSILIFGSVFYRLRKRIVVQQATWWMALVLVLLMFRWVVFGTLVS